MNQQMRPVRSLRDAWAALAGLSAVFLFEMLDTSILNVALPTIGRELHAQAAELQAVTSTYSLVFGGLMLGLGALADRYGRRRFMLLGLVLLGAASLATALVTTVQELIAIRALMGVAAALTAPGAMALAFRLFDDDGLRVRALTLISTVGLVGLAVGPPLGGMVLTFAPWQSLLLVNVPVAALALVGIWTGVAQDSPAPPRSPEGPRVRTLTLLTHPWVASGLAFKGAAGLATAGLGYLVTLQLQFDWGWPPALAALGMLPQVIVLLVGGAFVDPFVKRVGFDKAAWVSALAVVAGLTVYGALGRFGYAWVALALALVAAGLRVVGVVAATNVMRGLPPTRTTLGAALTDTVTQVAAALGLAVAGGLLAVLFPGDLSAPGWTPLQTAQFQNGETAAGLALALGAAVLVGWGIVRGHRTVG